MNKYIRKTNVYAYSHAFDVISNFVCRFNNFPGFKYRKKYNFLYLTSTMPCSN